MSQFGIRSGFIPSANFQMEPRFFTQEITFIQERSCHTETAGESLLLIMCWDLDGGSYVVHKGESRRMNENTFYESRSSECDCSQETMTVIFITSPDAEWTTLLYFSISTIIYNVSIEDSKRREAKDLRDSAGSNIFQNIPNSSSGYTYVEERDLVLQGVFNERNFIGFRQIQCGNSKVQRIDRMVRHADWNPWLDLALLFSAGLCMDLNSTDNVLISYYVVIDYLQEKYLNRSATKLELI